MKETFGISQDQLVENLEKIRNRKLCVYTNSSRGCDCKFGHHGEEPTRMSESFSGCPEVRQAMKIIDALTSEEFIELCNNAKIQL